MQLWGSAHLDVQWKLLQQNYLICRLVRLPEAEPSQKTITPTSTVSLHCCLPPFSVNSKGGLPEMNKNNAR